MADNSPRFFKGLEGLTRDLGVEEKNLYGRLGMELRAAWCIRAEDNRNGYVQQIVICQLERLIDNCGLTTEQQEVVRKAFNLTDRPSQKGLDERVRDLHMSSATYYRRRKEIFKAFDQDLQDDPPSREELAALMSDRYGIRISVDAIGLDEASPAAHTGLLTHPKLSFLANPVFLGAVAFVAATALVIPGAFYVRSQLRGNQDGNPQSLSSVAPSSTGAPSTKGSPSVSKAPAVMTATLASISSIGDDWKVAFPASLPDSRLAHFLQSGPLPDPDERDKNFAQELDLGGYAIGGLILQVHLEGLSNQEVTIYDVRLRRHKEQLPTGAAILIGSQGGANEQMYFDLDRPVPTARAIKEDHTVADSYFQGRHLTLRRGTKEILFLRFETAKGAYSFDIDFKYEVGGRRGSYTFNRSGVPFRVAPDTCPAESPSNIANKLSRVDRERIAKTYYRTVFMNSPDPYRLRTVEPKKICSSPQF